MGELRDGLDRVLKDYGVDWEINDPEYYEAMKDELIIVIKRILDVK